VPGGTLEAQSAGIKSQNASFCVGESAEERAAKRRQIRRYASKQYAETKMCLLASNSQGINQFVPKEAP
jgi:hypothetical protein